MRDKASGVASDMYRVRSSGTRSARRVRKSLDVDWVRNEGS